MDNISIIFVFINIFLYVNSFTIRDESLKDVIFKNSCNFPPRYLGDEYADKFEPCSQQTSNAVMEIICGNIRLESNCDLRDTQALPSTLVTLKLYSDKGNPDEKASHLAGLCSYMESLPWTQDNTCQNLCGNDAFFICDLYVAMDDALRDLFMREVQNYTHLDTFIHPGSLKFLYPFPPIGALHSPDLLGNCKNPSDDSVTNQLCTVMAEVAIQYVKAKLSVRLHEGEFVRNVSTNWDPCTGFSRFSNLINSSNFISLMGNCVQLCKDQLGVCKTIYLGLEKYQEAVGTGTGTATGSQLLNLKLNTKVMDSEVSGTDTSKQSPSGTETKLVTVVGAGTGEESEPKTEHQTGTGEESQVGTGTSEELQPGTGTGEESPTGTGTGKESQPGTGTGEGPPKYGTGKELSPKPDHGTGTVEEPLPQTGTGKESQAGTETGEVPKPKTEPETGTNELSQPGTGTGKESRPQSETSKVSPAGTETGALSQPKTELGTGTNELSKPGTGTGEESQLLPGTGEKSQPGPGTGEEAQPVPDTGEKSQPGLGTGEKSQLGPGTGEEAQPGNGTGEGSQPGTGTGEESQPGTGTGEGSQLGTGTGEGSQPGTGTGEESQQRTETGKESQPGTGTTAAIQMPTTSEFEYNYDDDDYYDEEYPDVFREPSPAAGQLDRNEEPKKESFKPKETKLDQAVYISDEDEESSGSHFMAYFLVFIVLSIAGYIIFHNKQKIIALVVEGKSTKGSRRPSTKDYKQLKTEDVMPSLEKSAYSKDYVF